MNALPLGTLLISVDVERGSGAPDRQDSALAHRVATTLSRADLPATLAVTQPGGSRLADGLVAEFPQAELALLAEDDWAGPTVKRRQFAAGLRRQLLRAADAGYTIRTLVLPDMAQFSHADLLVKHGLAVVRGAADGPAPRGMTAILRRFSGDAASLLVTPRGVRFGLWEVPVSASLPGAPGSLLRAWIDRAANARGIFHLRIDVPALLNDTRSSMVELGRLVELAASRRDAHRLRVVTLSELASGIRRHRAVPAQSILRQGRLTAAWLLPCRFRRAQQATTFGRIRDGEPTAPPAGPAGAVAATGCDRGCAACYAGTLPIAAIGTRKYTNGIAMNSTPILSKTGHQFLARRDFFGQAGSELAGIALAGLLSRQGLLAAGPDRTPIRPQFRPEAPLAARLPHFEPAAKRVLLIFCSGACSHLDTFDYKPELIRRHGEPLPGGDELITFQGEQGAITKSPWEFKPRGESGKYVSELLPHLAELADEMCFIHSMTAKSNTHGPAENQMSTGFTLDGFPSAGAWVSYALGSEADDLPAFVAIPDPRGVPQSGPSNWGAGFLPAVVQGTAFSADKPIPNLARPEGISAAADRAAADFLKRLNDKHLEKFPGDTQLAARIASYELAAKMQLRAAEAGDLTKESAVTRQLYCVDDANRSKAGFGRNCLLARRLLERGVRCVQLFNGAYAMGEGVGNWDGHKTLQTQYEVHGPILDEPAAALLKDLKACGLLDDTLVVWVTEFGRMPTFQKGASGRDHNPAGFTVWLAGAGVKRATSYGATDEFGYKAVENVCTIYDLHATLLHLLGLHHERLSFYHNGIERRLTDVHGRVIEDILA